MGCATTGSMSRRCALRQRAALLSGRNNHTVGFGSVGEFAGRLPGYSATLPRDCAPLPRVLRDNGYSTAAFGKWHLTPDGRQGMAGPFDRWPNGWGFDYFYGFLGGEPVRGIHVTENQKIIGTPEGFYDDEDPFYFPDAMADRTIEWLHSVRAQDAQKPFFVYFSTGCSHSPHHVAREWADKYKGKFDQGWDRLHEETFARQKALGVVPADAELTLRDEAFPAWDDVPDKQKSFYARQMEVYAGYSENADYNVGRVIDAIEELGELDNTLILWIWGDNGASMEGTITGSFNELTMQNGIPLTDEMQLQLSERYGGLDQWGAAIMDPHYGAAWAWAGNAPFKWGKQVGSHLGGTAQPVGRALARSHPGHRGAALPVHSRHRCDSDDPRYRWDPGAPVRRRDRAGADARIHVRRVVCRAVPPRTPHPAVLRDDRQPGHVQGRVVAGDEDGTHPVGAHPGHAQALCARYGIRCGSGRAVLPARRLRHKDRDIAADHPDKVHELKALFWEEAERYKVLPLLATLSTFFGMLPPIPEETTFEFRGDVQNVLSGMIPRIYNRSYAITADLVVPEGGAEGVIVAEADHLGGFTLYVKDGKLTHTYSMMGVFVYKQVADEGLPMGDVTVRMEFAADAAKPATGGEVTLFIDDRPVGTGRMDHTVPVRFSGYSGIDIGRDSGGVVDRAYEEDKPFRVSGHSQEGGVRHQTPPLGPGRRRPPHRRPPRTSGARTVGMTTDIRSNPMKIDDETTDVLIGGYLSTDAAHEDYEAVLGCGGPPVGRSGPSARTSRAKVSVGARPITPSRRAPPGSPGSGSSSACSRHRCSPRPRSGRYWAPSGARRCTRRSAAASRRWRRRRIPIGGARPDRRLPLTR